MRVVAMETISRTLLAFGTGCALAIASFEAQAQQQDRERAQMMQMQQQMQRLQSDNASLARDKSQLQEQAKEADKLKKDSVLTAKDLAKAKAQAAAGTRDVAALRAQIEEQRDQITKQIEDWKKAIAERDSALQVAALEKRRLEMALSLLETRVKVQTTRSDLCEAKHEQTWQFASQLIDRYSQDHVRACEPVMALWKVHDGTDVQSLQDKLYEMRLDVPPKAAPAASANPAPAPAPAAASTTAK